MSGYTPTLTKSFPVTAVAIDPHLIVAATGDGKLLEAANAATDLLIGTSGSMGAPASGMVDVDLAGIGEVRFGGNVEMGEPLTANAQGRAIKAVQTSSQMVRIIGFAMAEGVDGDIAPYLIAPGILTKSAA